MLESTFHEDWDEMGTKMVKKGHLLPKSGINSKLVRCQRVKGVSGVSFQCFGHPNRIHRF